MLKRAAIVARTARPAIAREFCQLLRDAAAATRQLMEEGGGRLKTFDDPEAA